MADSISLEETNALRAKLGLPALGGDDDAEEVVDQDTQAYENYQKQKQQENKAKQEQEIRDKIERSKNRKKELAKLKGKGLGEAGGDEDDDALSWIRKSRKREKELAARRAKEQAEMDEEFANYDANDLSGLKVAHDISEFTEGGETILTLKDRGILEDEDTEELTNVNLEDKERLQKNLENKKKKPGYNPYDDEEFVLGGKKKSVLPQYEDEQGPQGFRIGQQGRVDRNDEQQTVSEKLKAQTLSYEKMQEIKDYYTQDEVNLSFKKPKKKKKKDKLRKRVKQDDEPVVEEEKPVAEDEKPKPAPRPATVDTDISFVDDDDLQMALSRTRRAANRQREKKTKRMTVEEIAQSIAADRSQRTNEEEEEQQEGLVLSEMTEFVNSLGTDAVFTPREPARSVREAQAAAAAAEESVGSTAVTMEEVPDESIQEEEEQSTTPPHAPVEPAQEESAIMEEPLVSRGMAATLSLLSQKGFVAKPTQEQIQRDRDQAERMRWIAEQKKLDVQRERERQQDRLRQRERDARSGGRDRERAREREREREREKELEEREAMREFEKRMEEYKPDVKLEYFDEHGHQMNTKEAFRFMSHKFHGKTSGKTKTEKRMQKLEEELKLNMMSNNDTPLNLATKLLERQQRTGNAHVVLSVGNRGVVAPTMPADLAAESSKKRPRANSDEGTSDKKRK
ncbi:SART-1 protein [Fennellomyces sp. T-0311]|nr:SART-1 protein [Fennellomyces sp. T-0311]